MSGSPDSARISETHRSRRAIIYVRQSSPGQVRDHGESTRRQLGLREKAIALGWVDPVVIDDDLGVSAAGYAERAGFRRVLALVVAQDAGIVMCLEAARLSRNSKDWAHLFELCGHFDVLIADEEQVYNLALPNDRLILGIKGTISELELSVMRGRLRAGVEAKAARGELKFMLPPGYVHDLDSRIVMDPDKRVQDAIRLMFERFEQATSVRQLALWYHDTNTTFPVRRSARAGSTAWELPRVATLRKYVVHPIYAGAYVWGRRRREVEYRNGRLVKRRGALLSDEECHTCIRDHHPAYISWERLEENRKKLAQARPRWTMNQTPGAVREGLALLTGILRCGHCGRQMRVAYKTRSALYYCDGGKASSSKRCLSFGSYLIDRRVARELCRAVQPLAVGAAEQVEQHRVDSHSRLVDGARLRVQQAQYEVDRAFEQFDQVDPKNRLVADALEGRLNERLAELHEAKAHEEKVRAGFEPLTAQQRARLKSLADDFSAAWDHSAADTKIRKQILRVALQEVVVKKIADHSSLEVILHWSGGAHTRIEVEKRSPPRGSRRTKSRDREIEALAATLDDAQIARVLNMKRLTTPEGTRWSQGRVQEFREQRGMSLPPSAQSSEGVFLTGQQAAEYLGISRHGLSALIERGALKNSQPTDFAPWRIRQAELDSDLVQNLVRTLKKTGRLPLPGGCPEGQEDLFPRNFKDRT